MFKLFEFNRKVIHGYKIEDFLNAILGENDK